VKSIVADIKEKKDNTGSQQHLEHDCPVMGIIPPGSGFYRFTHDFQ